LLGGYVVFGERNAINEQVCHLPSFLPSIVAVAIAIIIIIIVSVSLPIPSPT
jgi:hypothetical protein